MVARLIIMRAYDHAVQPANSTDDGNPILFSRGCLLTEFMKCLFSSQETGKVLVLNSVSDIARKGEELGLGEEFEKVRIRVYTL